MQVEWQITEQNILDAIADARSGELDGHAYDQGNWCGTACCVLGFARLRAGLLERNTGPQPGEIEDSPRCRRIAELMLTGDPQILDAAEGLRLPETIGGLIYFRGKWRTLADMQAAQGGS